MSFLQTIRTWITSASKCSLVEPGPAEVAIFSVLFPKTWSEFVSCIKRYTSDCLTPDQVEPRSTQSGNFFFCRLFSRPRTAAEICKSLLLFLTNNRDFRDLTSTELWETVLTAYTRCAQMKLTSEVSP